MKEFIYNTSVGKMFFAEFGNFIQSNCINGTSHFYEDVFMVMFEEYFVLSDEDIKQLSLIAYNYDLILNFRAESNCLIVEFSLNKSNYEKFLFV